MIASMKLNVEIDREEDGRWIADVLELPGVMSYGETRESAIAAAERLAVDVVEDRIQHGELPSEALNLSFTIQDEHLTVM